MPQEGTIRKNSSPRNIYRIHKNGLNTKPIIPKKAETKELVLESLAPPFVRKDQDKLPLARMKCQLLHHDHQASTKPYKACCNQCETAFIQAFIGKGVAVLHIEFIVDHLIVKYQHYLQLFKAIIGVAFFAFQFLL